MPPPEAPSSGSIFSSGFYSNGRAIKFRTGLCSALISYNAIFIDLFLKVLTSSVIFGSVLMNIYKGSRIGYIFFLACLFAIGFTDTISNLLNYTLFPSMEININSEFVRKGHLFVWKIPFKIINEIIIHKRRRGLRMGMIGTEIYLSSAAINGTVIRIATLHQWEEEYVTVISKSLMCLMKKEMCIQYIANEEDA
jgi:hypothetical protein